MSDIDGIWFFRMPLFFVWIGSLVYLSFHLGIAAPTPEGSGFFASAKKTEGEKK